MSTATTASTPSKREREDDAAEPEAKRPVPADEVELKHQEEDINTNAATTLREETNNDPVAATLDNVAEQQQQQQHNSDNEDLFDDDEGCDDTNNNSNDNDDDNAEQQAGENNSDENNNKNASFVIDRTGDDKVDNSSVPENAATEEHVTTATDSQQVVDTQPPVTNNNNNSSINTNGLPTLTGANDSIAQSYNYNNNNNASNSQNSHNSNYNNSSHNSGSAHNPSEEIEERAIIPPQYVGKVIGKGGEMIRDLQARSGARLDIDDKVPPGMPRSILYRGPRHKVEFAKQLVAMLCQPNGVFNEAEMPLGEAARQTLVVPQAVIGKIIGHGGDVIRDLQGRSHTRIQINHSPVPDLSPDQRQVMITGTADNVKKGVELVQFLASNPDYDAAEAIKMLIADKVQTGQPWGTGPPYPNLPNGGYNMPSAKRGGGGNMYQGNANAMTYGGGGGYQQQMMQQQPPQMQAYPGMAPQAAYGGQPPMSGFNSAYGGGGKESDMVYVPKQFMGRIIGSKGATINDLQRRSSTDIQCNQNVGPNQDCEVTIKGERPGIDLAKQMIQEIIEVGPGHQYAGGAASGYGANRANVSAGSYGATTNYGGGYGGYQPAVAAAPVAATGGFNQGYDYNQSYGGGYQQQQPAPQQQQQSIVNPQQRQAPYAAPAAASYGQPYGQQPQQAANNFGYAAAAPMAPAAISGWKSASTPEGQVYYYNEATGATQWNKPAGMP